MPSRCVHLHWVVVPAETLLKHVAIIPPAEWQTIVSSVGEMIQALDHAATLSLDTPDAPPVQLGTRISDGSAGRPRVDIDPQDLAALFTGHTTLRQIAILYNCDERTIRRRVLEYGLAPPGPPVYVQQPQADGTIVRVYSAGSSSRLSQLTDEELNGIMLQLYERFPTFGRRMIDGYLL